MNSNTFVAFFLKTPLHGMMSSSTMLITVTGRKTGRQITTPVNYYQEGDTLWVLTSRDRKWWRNIQNCPEVSLVLRGKKVKGLAEVVLDRAAVAAQLSDYVRHLPMSARALNIQVNDQQANPADLERVASTRLMVRVKVT